MLRKGSQEPTFSTVGTWSYTGGEEVISTLALYGIKFFKSQEFEMRVFMARNDDGLYSALTICISKPRQNGKSYAVRFYCLWMAAIEGRRVLFSAHHGKTVRKMFKELRNFVEGTPDFAALLVPGGRGIYAAAGSEGIYFVNEDGTDGGCIEFQTRTNSAARGETYHVIVVDEAQELTDEQLDALKPTTFAASDVESGSDEDPQMIYLGTPPNAKCPGTVFRRYHDSAHADDDNSIWWMEWAVEEIPDTTDRKATMELVYLTNPAMGYRIKEKTMLDAMDTMSADGFARECLGWWSKTEDIDRAIRTTDWNACKVDNPSKEGTVTYGVKFSPDGSTGVLAACHRPDEGKPFVYVVDSRSLSGGIGWFVDNLSSRWKKAAQIVIDGQSNAQNLNDRLLKEGVSFRVIKRPTAGNAIAAYSTLANAVKERELTHYGQPALDASATKTRKRPIGNNGGWGFASTDEADATLIEACALAYWGAMTTKRKPGRKAVVR